MYTSSASSSTRFMNSSKPCWRDGDVRLVGDMVKRRNIRWYDRTKISSRKRRRKTGSALFQNANEGHTIMNASMRNSLLSNNQTVTRLCYIPASFNEITEVGW